MKFEILTVTPELAAKWLACGITPQRSVKQGRVLRYAREMTAGRWRLTHQAVAFNAEGQMIDGQHRMLAVIRSGVGVPIAVAWSAPGDSIDCVDLTQERSAADIFRIQGRSDVTAERVAIARTIEYGTDSVALRTNRSPQELALLVERHAEAISFVLANKPRYVRGVTVSVVLGAVAVAHYTVRDRAKLADFMLALISGVASQSGGDRTVICLRDWLMATGSSVGNGPLREEAFLKVQRAIKAYLDNELLTKLRAPTVAYYRAPEHA